MCARRHLLLSTRILCSPARPELSAAPKTRWVASCTGLVANLCKVVVCRWKGTRVFFSLNAAKILHSRKGSAQPEPAELRLLSQGTLTKTESFRLHVFAFLFSLFPSQFIIISDSHLSKTCNNSLERTGLCGGFV